jgi:hypothetical protein
MRAPEVVQWVMAALSKVEEDMAALAASSGGAGDAAECSEQGPEDATQTSEQDRPKGIPPPKMTIAGEGPDRGHWWSEDQVRALVGGIQEEASKP